MAVVVCGQLGEGSKQFVVVPRSRERKPLVDLATSRGRISLQNHKEKTIAAKSSPLYTRQQYQTTHIAAKGTDKSMMRTMLPHERKVDAILSQFGAA